MKKIWIIGLWFVAMGWVGLMSGCRAEECQKMSRCCEAIQDVEGVGNACGQIAQGVKDPDTCRTILKTVHAMFEKRGEPVPESCQ